MEKKYDIIVIGAGPAGSYAAFVTARAGCRVLILEKDPVVGVPVRCGEGVGMVGLKMTLEPRSEWFGARCKGVKLISPSGYQVTVHDSNAAVLDRTIFDKAICDMAVAQGATLLTSCMATGLIEKEGQICGVKIKFTNQKDAQEFDLEAKIVIAADGVESRIARLAGLNSTNALRDLEVTASYVMDHIQDQEYCYFYTGKKIAPGGYVWIFPKGGDRANVGIGIVGSAARYKKPIEYLDHFVKTYLPHSRVIDRFVGSVPVGLVMKKTTRDGFMVIGDAAHHVNPVSGGGITYGLNAAKFAGRVAAESIRRGDYSDRRLRKYHQEWVRKIGKSQRRSYRLKEVLMKVPDEVIDQTAERLMKKKKGRTNFLSAFVPLVKHRPRVVWDVFRIFF